MRISVENGSRNVASTDIARAGFSVALKKRELGAKSNNHRVKAGNLAAQPGLEPGTK